MPCGKKRKNRKIRTHKRKKLLTTLRKSLKIPEEKLKTIFKTLKLDENIRPEDLSVENWQKLNYKLQ